jgi:hypothetical protein
VTLQINLGDIGARIARGFGVKGRVPVAVDEQAVFVTLLHDLTDSLYSQNPATFSVLIPLVGSVGNFSIGWIGNRQPDLVTKLDAMTIIDTSTTAPVNPVLWWGSRNTGVPAGSTFAGGGILNQPTKASGAAGPLLVRPRSLMETNAPAANPFATWTQLGSFFPAQNTAIPFVIPLGLVLYQNDGFGISMGPEAVSVTRQIVVFGREFSQG